MLLGKLTISWYDIMRRRKEMIEQGRNKRQKIKMRAVYLLVTVFKKI